MIWFPITSWCFYSTAKVFSKRRASTMPNSNDNVDLSTAEARRL